MQQRTNKEEEKEKKYLIFVCVFSLSITQDYTIFCCLVHFVSFDNSVISTFGSDSISITFLLCSFEEDHLFDTFYVLIYFLLCKMHSKK